MAALPTDVHDLLAAQHGHVARSQLCEIGLSSNQIKHFARRGDLIRTGRCVYRSPSVQLTEAGRCAALCLARPGIVISGPTAGRLWGFRKVSADLRIHLLMPPQANSVTTDASIVAHRTSQLRPDDIVERCDGIRVTSRPRTCFDLATSLSPDALLSVMEQAMCDGPLTTADLVEVAIGQVRRAADASVFLAQLDRRVAGGAAESDGEVCLGDALRSQGVTGMVRQHRVALPLHGSIRFDLAVPELRWAVELDLFPTHEETVGAAADVRRDAAAEAEGWLVRRVTKAQYDREFHATVAWLTADARSRSASLPRPD